MDQILFTQFHLITFPVFKLYSKPSDHVSTLYGNWCFLYDIIVGTVFHVSFKCPSWLLDFFFQLWDICYPGKWYSIKNDPFSNGCVVQRAMKPCEWCWPGPVVLEPAYQQWRSEQSWLAIHNIFANFLQSFGLNYVRLESLTSLGSHLTPHFSWQCVSRSSSCWLTGEAPQCCQYGMQ